MNSLYAGNGSSCAIAGLSAVDAEGSQLNVTADAGGEGAVIYDSAVSFWQGFYPPRPSVTTITLGNGTNITSPLNGYQYVKVATVLPEDSVSFESWVNCQTWTSRNTDVYDSAEFKARAEVEQPFLDDLKASGILGNRSATLSNAYNVNVNYLHNQTYAAEVNATGDGTLAHLRDLANYHEAAIYTAPDVNGVGNVAGLTLLPRIISSLQEFTKDDNEVRIAHYHLAYKPFLSLFNMTELASARNPPFPYPRGMVDYASAAVYELRPGGSGSSGFDVRFGFRNGSETTDDVTYYPLFGSDSLDTDLNDFMTKLPASDLLTNNSQWCSWCNSTATAPVCSEIYLSEQYEDLYEKYKGIADGHFTSVGSGFIGFAVTFVLMLAALGVFYALGWIQLGKRRPVKQDRYPLNDHDSFKGSVATTA
ncbi:hypothetical protein JCM10213v2_007311 [Rhodosporidiobolus nylandii]